jgi:TrpR family trp operon transcriptional repressor
MPEIKEISEVLSEMTDPQEIEGFLHEILTENEIRDISLRWALLKKLFDGVPQRSIATDLGISLCKITRGSRILKNTDSVTRKLLTKLRGNEFSG